MEIGRVFAGYLFVSGCEDLRLETKDAVTDRWGEENSACMEPLYLSLFTSICEHRTNYFTKHWKSSTERQLLISVSEMNGDICITGDFRESHPLTTTECSDESAKWTCQCTQLQSNICRCTFICISPWNKHTNSSVCVEFPPYVWSFWFVGKSSIKSWWNVWQESCESLWWCESSTKCWSLVLGNTFIPVFYIFLTLETSTVYS